MGVISKQASRSALYNYIGVIIGFVNITLLMTQLFTQEEFGLRETLLSVAVFSSHIAHLGTYRSLVKFYPFFRKDNKNDNGLLTIGLLVPLIGFLLVSTLIVIFKPLIVDTYIDKSPLFVEYFWFSFPLFFLFMYSNVFESYLQSRSNTTFSVFIKSIFNRVFITILLVAYYFDLIDFYWFILLFIFSYFLNILLFVIYLYRRGELNLKLNTYIFNKRVRRIYLDYSSFSILSGASSVLINKIDALMIASFLGLASTATYINSLYLAVLISIPGDSIGKIALPMLSRSWKLKNMNEIESIYKKTSLTQFLIGGTIFILMWGSIDNFYSIQGKEYFLGKWVFFIISCSKLINLIFGSNTQIINVSKYYRFDTTSAIILGILTVLSNLLLIPIWGIEGAAIATASTIIIFNLLRCSFIYWKLKIQPFTLKTLYAFVILFFAYGVNELIPFQFNIYIDTIFRSLILLTIISIPVYFFKVSEDINKFVNQNFNKIFRR